MRLTRTNSGPDSKGVVRFGRWELEGEAYLYVVVGGVLSILVFAMAVSQPMPLRIGMSMGPLLLSVAWVKRFVLGKAPHYLGDQVERLFVGPHFNLHPQDWMRVAHPRAASPEKKEAPHV